MQRPSEGELLGTRVFVASAEDTVISKLEWAQLGGGSELQLRDAAGILTLQGRSKLDVAYIEHWVRELGLEDSWRRLLATTGGQDE
jgi:hypothetical protein